MAVKLHRPILVGGIGLSFSLWALESLHHSDLPLGEFGVLGAIALGTGFWWVRQLTAKDLQLSLATPQIDREKVEQAIAANRTVIAQLAAEAVNLEANSKLESRATQLTTELARQEIRLAVTGGKGVGKTTLMEVLAANWKQPLPHKLFLTETPALFSQNAGATAEKSAQEVAIASDLTLFVTTGDLTDSEWQFLQQLAAANQKIVLAFNKQDQYLPESRAVILHQLRQRMQGIVGEENIVAIATSPSSIKVRQHQPDGAVQEWMEQPNPEIADLTERLNQILIQENQQLVLATTWRSAVALKADVRTVLNGVRSDRALPQIEQFQWIAAAAAFANPVPALDLLATAAITAQMVVDLGAIYQQKFSLQQAQTVATTLGSLMLKLGLVELTTQTIGSILKSNAITYVAGGLVQGVSAAYLTRLAGLSLIEYFQEQEVAIAESRPGNLEKLGQTLQKVFQQNQRVAFLQSFVKQAAGRLMPESSQPEMTTAAESP